MVVDRAAEYPNRALDHSLQFLDFIRQTVVRTVFYAAATAATVGSGVVYSREMRLYSCSMPVTSAYGGSYQEG
jgi:hypothetical protein